MSHKQMVRIIVENIGAVKASEKLHVGHSTVYYWMLGERNPGYHAGIAIEKEYKKIEKRKKSS